MKGVFDVFKLPVGKRIEKDNVIISTYEFSNKKDPLFNLRAVRDGGDLFYMEDGKYVRLNIDGQLMMSDTRMEKISNTEFVEKANGRVLVGGLGIGLVIYNLMDKLIAGIVTEIVVIEKEQSLIDLVAPFYKHKKIKIICSDINEYTPNKGEKFDTIYFDIWADINEDNLKEIKFLHNRFKSKLNRSNPNCWMESWMKKYLQKRKRSERNSYW